MEIFNNGCVVKIVPAKFTPIIDGFKFESQKKRLTKNERHSLIVLLIRNHFKQSEFHRDPQMIYACNIVSKAKEIKILKVNKRGHTDWRISADGVQFRVDYDIVGDCPNEFLEVKYEF